MSDSILDHGYIPEEHAPDPVIGHGDPTPPGKVGAPMGFGDMGGPAGLKP